MLVNRALKSFARFLAVPALAAAALAATPAQAVVVPFSYSPTYTLTSSYDIYSIVLAGLAEEGTPAEQNYFVNSFEASPGTAVIVDPFPRNSLPLDTFVLGVSLLQPLEIGEDSFRSFAVVPIDPVEPTQHLVLGLNNTFAESTFGEEFTDFFPGFDETSLIGALNTLSQRSGTPTTSQLDAAVNLIFSFKDAVHSANADFTLGSNFTLTGFSDGQFVGTGTSAPVFLAGAVPEPSMWLMMIGGFGMIGFVFRRRPAQTHAYA